MPPGKFHRPELDVLRFVAFLLVFLHHALPHSSAAYSLPLPAARLLAAAARAGALGVDLFFALSAYLITALLLREHRRTSALDLPAFYARRALRIWPLYFFALFALAPAMRLINPADRLSPDYLAAYALLGGNWACALAGFPPSSFSLLWSVSIEEQFYLAWPLLLRRHVPRIGIFAAVMLLTATATRALLALQGTIHPGVWCNTLARLDPIALGAFLAWKLDGRLPQLPPVRRTALFAAGLLGLFLAGGLGDHAGWSTLLTYPASSLAAFAILYATLGLGGNPILGYLGKISFGLYVLHAAALRITSSPPAALLLTIAAAALSYRFLETPFLRLKDRFTRA